ncbi:MAG: outer membrane protein transport protein [Candidatus Krumholzibacteriota bacterium]|nr:outer membrane protein transport protein [Candidatus Krumholzibacteriota bacterium]
MSARARFLLLTGVLLLIAAAARGAGFAIWEMGTKSSGMGGVATASADDPAAVFYNPAGLARLGRAQLSLDLTTIDITTEFSGVAPHPGYGVTEHLADPFFVLPQLYVAVPVGERFALGLGINTPYGLSVEWAHPDTFTGRHVATFTDLKTYFVSPAVAWQATERVSLGFSLNLVLAEVELNKHIVEILGNPTEVGKVRIRGDNELSLGYNFGLLVDLGPRTTLGLDVKSRIDLELAGNADFTAFTGYEAVLPADGPVETELPLPNLVSLGVSHRFGERWRLEFNYNRIQWSAFETLDLHFPAAPAADESIHEDYTNTSQYRLGVEYQAAPSLVLRAGAVRDESPQPTGSCGPVLPDADRRGVSLGASWCRGAVTLEAYNLFLFLDDRAVRDNYDGYQGDYRSFTNLLGAGLTYHF